MDADTPRAKAGQTRKRRARHERRTTGEAFIPGSVWVIPAAVFSAAACPSRGIKEKNVVLEIDDDVKFIKIVYGCGHSKKFNRGVRVQSRFAW